MNDERNKVDDLFVSTTRVSEIVPENRSGAQREYRRLLLVNPLAGKGSAVDNLGTYLTCLSADGVAPNVYITKSGDDFKDFLRTEGRRYDHIIAVGGDGTLNELVSVCQEQEIQPLLSILPAGTTGDFAYSLNIPNSAQEAAAVAMSGHSGLFDLGCLNQEKYFVYVASFGAFTESSYATPRELKNTFGRLAYIAHALQNLQQLHPIKTHIEADGLTIDDEFALASFMNTTRLGGILQLKTEDVYLDDGYFELLLVRFPQNPADVTAILSSLASREFTGPQFEFIKAKEVSIEFPEENVAWTIDGEFGGEYSSVQMHVLKQAWRLSI